MKDLTPSLLDPDKLTLILDSLRIGIIIHTSERIILSFNKEAERITVYTKAEVLNKDCHNVFSSPFCGNKCSFCDTIPTFHSNIKEYPLAIVTKDGSTRKVEMSVSPIKDQEGTFNGVIASFRDMTETFNLSLKAEDLSNFAGIIGKDKVMQDVFRQIQDVAMYTYPVHVAGETGTGKERVACAIHDISSFGNGAF
ncbi:MAG: PAS domain-containing protein, partial [Desulfobacteraceae bacterium]|nr:PAS domain-containing protein [Desulfobacteraceae bacterium]